MKKTIKYSILGLAALCTVLLCGGYYMLGYSLKPDDLVSRSRNIAASYDFMYERYPELHPWVDSLMTAGALKDFYIENDRGEPLHALYVAAAHPTLKTAVIVHGYTDNAVRMLMIGYLYNKEMDFIANGEIIQVLRVRRTYELYGFRFADVSVRFQDYDLETDVKILLDTLQTAAPALPKDLNDKLFYTILEDYDDVPTKVGKMKKMKADPHYNVLQVKYAYAVTCHKAQGGQWMNVFLDIGYITEEMLGEDFYRWLYTAFTRATHRLYLVNLPEEFEEYVSS